MTRRDVAAMRLAYEWLRVSDGRPMRERDHDWHLEMALDVLFYGLADCDDLLDAMPSANRSKRPTAPGGKYEWKAPARLLCARLALYIRARLRAEAWDCGPLYCTCFDEPRAVATHRDARHCRKPHPMRITPLWEQAAQWWTTHERPGGGR